MVTAAPRAHQIQVETTWKTGERRIRLDGTGMLEASWVGGGRDVVGLMIRSGHGRSARGRGVPIVARELEARTAQTAWSLSGSRLRWLLRQMAPILILLGVTVSFGDSRSTFRRAPSRSTLM